MAEIATLARPYAEAVFKLADESGRLAEWSAWLRTMAGVTANADVQACLGNPQVSASQLAELVVAGCGKDVPGEVRNFAELLVGNHRLELAPEISAQFEALRLEREGLVDAQVETAFALDDAQLGTLVAELERRFKRKVRPLVRVAPELIGGVRITVGDEVIDGSVRAKLAAMATAIAKV
jgi:F-type H+-transporting ATPase subunit delta